MFDTTTPFTSLQVNVYGIVPPVTVILTPPLLNPNPETSVTTSATSKTAGCVI